MPVFSFRSKLTTSRGQSLLLVIIAMTIALTVGLAVTNRVLDSIRRTSSTDTSARVYSAAEGGIEWFLRQPVGVLETLADGNTDNGRDCPAGTTWDSTDPQSCVITYQPQDNDKIKSKANIYVKHFSFNYLESGNNHYWFTLKPGDVKEVSLSDLQRGEFYHGDIDICWNSLENVQSSAIYYTTYNEDGVEQKQIIAPPITKPGTIFSISGDTIAGPGRLDYENCHTVNIADDTDIYGLRIKSLYSPSKVAVFPISDEFPIQGYEIVSIGRLDNEDDDIEAVKQIKVYRSFPYAPSLFDYGIYSAEPIN
jgi:hypothetical protein